MKLINLGSQERDIYVFYREDDNTPKITQFRGFFPYYYEAVPGGDCLSYDNKKLKKIFVSRPRDIIKRRTNHSYEADLKLHQQFMLDKVDKIDPCPYKIAYVDIEVQCTALPDTSKAQDPISCISVYNSLSKSVQTFFLPDYKAEYDMLAEFLAYMKQERFDIMTAWNVNFDYNYLFNRTKALGDFSEKISPVGLSRYHNQDVTYPLGMSIIDYYTWFKLITLNREKSYKLDDISQKYLGSEPNAKVDFSKITDDIREKNKLDVIKMAQLEERKQLFPYYDEIRRLTKVEWEDLIYTSRMIDKLLLQESKNRKIVLPMKPKNDNVTKKEEFAGAYREVFELGRHEKVYKADLGCVDEKTRILTKNGFKSYHEICLGELVLTFNIRTQQTEYQPILAIPQAKVENYEMISLFSTTTDQCLTPNHRVLLQRYQRDRVPHYWRDYEFYRADEIPSYSRLPLSAPFTLGDKILTDDEVELFGWIISEGCFAKTSNAITISQSEANAGNCRQIEKLLSRLQIPFTDNKRLRRRYIEHEYYIPARIGRKIRTKLPEKRLTPNLLSLSLLQLKLLLRTLILGDGSSRINQKNSEVYFTDDKILAYQVLELVFKCGYRTKIYQRNSKTSKTGIRYHVNISKRKSNVTIHKSKIKPQVAIKKICYSGQIWCVTTQNQTWVAERNGKIFITGNSAYPQSIINFCLDTRNITADEGLEINGTYFKQTENALLPTVIKKLINLKDTIKQELNQASIDDPKYKDIKTRYAAIKGLVNGCYGVFGNRFFRVFDIRVASATTFLVRSLLHYVKDKLAEQHIKVVYIDTDSVMYVAEKDLTVYLNELVQQWGKETFGKENVDITFTGEGYFEQILIVALCRYIGRLRNVNNELEIEVKGVETKRKDSSKFIVKFQKALMNKILDNVPKDEIFNWIRSEIAGFKTQKLIDIAFPCKIAKPLEEYKHVPVFVRALDSTPEFNASVGENFYYIYMEGTDEKRKDNVKAFNADVYQHINREELNWDKMLSRNIIDKCEGIFTAMKWNLIEVYEPPIKLRKPRKKGGTSDDKPLKRGKGKVQEGNDETTK